MKLTKISVRNYRLHKERSFEFDKECTLFGGANETGKSTLVEAAHRALFLKAKGSSERHKSMRSTLHTGYPEVELEFESGGDRYKVSKKYSGNNGKATLTDSAGNVLHDSDAEEKLLELTRAEEDSGRTGQMRQWAHLWAWQGEVDQDPENLASERFDQLVRLIGDDGAAAVGMTSLDKEVSDSVATSHLENFTAGGKLAAHSKLSKVNAEVEEAQERHDAELGKIHKLEQAIQDYDSATRQIKEQANALEANRKQQSQLEERASMIQDVKIKLDKETQAFETSQDSLKLLEAENRKLLQKKADIKATREKLQPKEAEKARLKKQIHSLSEQLEACRKKSEDAHAALEVSRGRLELARLYQLCFHEEETASIFSERLAKQKILRQQARECKLKLAALPLVGSKAIKELQKQENQVQKLETELNAIAASVQLLVPDPKITLDGKAFPEDAPYVLSKGAIVEIEGVPTLKITPGGGTNLDDLHQALEEAKSTFLSMLEKYRVKSMDEAYQAKANRDSLDKELDAYDAEARGLGGAELEDDLATVEEKHKVLKASLVSKTAKMEGFLPPEDLEATWKLMDSLIKEVNDLEAEENDTRREVKALEESKEGLSKDLEKQSSDYGKLNQNLVEAMAVLQAEETRMGDGTTRAARLLELKEQAKLAKNCLQETKAKLESLDPSSLEKSRNRLKNVEETANDLILEANRKKSTAAAILEADGSLDPKEAVQKSAAKLQGLQEEQRIEEKSAKAIQLLDRLFQEEKQAVADRYAAPLTNKVNGYLSKIFGGEAKMQLSLQENRFTEFSLQRPDRGDAAIGFKQLSKGAKEQVAVAIRLAMAEVLASEHDGTLPVILDDAFVNSDPDRILKVQAMLDHAVGKGLQVIVMSCTPAEYAGLGARTIML